MKQQHNLPTAEDVLSPIEIKQLIMATMNGRIAQQEEMEEVLRWAHTIRIGEATLELVLKGMLSIGFVDGKLAFKTNDEPDERVANMEAIIAAADCEAP